MKSLLIFCRNDKFVDDCGKGDLKNVQNLLENGADVNAKHDGYTGLHLASKRGHNDIIKCLIVNNANIDEKDDKNGETPLMYAASECQTLVVKTLLLSGADEKKECNGRTAFSKAKGDVKDILE